MVRMLASENATQRGSTAAAALDAVAAVSKVLVFQCLRWDLGRFAKIIANLPTDAAENIWGNVRRGEGPGERSGTTQQQVSRWRPALATREKYRARPRSRNKLSSLRGGTARCGAQAKEITQNAVISSPMP